MKLEIAYFSDTDTLSLWNGKPASEAGDVFGNLLADYDAQGKVVGFTVEHAGEFLLDHLFSVGVDFGYSGIDSFADQCPYSLQMTNGALELTNFRPVVSSDEVAEHLTAHYDADGDAVGFTLERAAELLLPHLKGEAASQRVPVSASFAENDN